MLRLLRLLFRRRKNRGDPPAFEVKSSGHALPVYPDEVVIDNESFYQRTGYRIRNQNYFKQALIHRSYLQLLGSGSLKSNERLEFLGDAVLNFLVAEHLFYRFRDAAEGKLTKIRSQLVKRRALVESARRIHLREFLLLSPSATQSLNTGSDSILADAFEALVAAVYLDGGYQAARDFVRRNLVAAFDSTRLTKDDNFKSQLLEFSQAHSFGIPKYETIKEEGPDHNPVFTVEVSIGGVSWGRGHGPNKKAAEQRAAHQALERFEKELAQKDNTQS